MEARDQSLHLRGANCPSSNKLTRHTRKDCELADTSQEIANFLNRFFFSVFKPTPSDNETLLDCTESRESNILLTEESEEEVRSVLLSLNEDKATGPDKIPAILLKNCAGFIIPSVCQLFNKSLSSEKLPSWKLANICPIPKNFRVDGL